MESGTKTAIAWTITGFFIIFFITIFGMWGCPQWNVYSQRMTGQAILAHAQSSREVAVAEAKAKMESASLLAQADTLRAHGVARSNEIIGKSLKENEVYLKWMWISDLKDSKNQVIYIPTEAQMPILEAGKR